MCSLWLYGAGEMAVLSPVWVRAGPIRTPFGWKAEVRFAIEETSRTIADWERWWGLATRSSSDPLRLLINGPGYHGFGANLRVQEIVAYRERLDPAILQIWWGQPEDSRLLESGLFVEN